MDSQENFAADAERLLDQLVDGELTGEERRQLLLKLDNQTDGWRRCALAFLEAQAWGKECRALTSTPVKEPTVQPAVQRSAWPNSRWTSFLAIAASFFVAFGLGLASRGVTWFDRREPVQFAQRASPPEKSPTAAAASTPVVVEDRSPQWDTVTVSLAGNQDGIAESFDLPFVTGEGIDEQWLRSQPSAVPPQVLRALERLGHQVERQRAYLPIDLNDGRRVVVPVDQFNVRYVGERSYQ
jgi:hypothetical protein